MPGKFGAHEGRRPGKEHTLQAPPPLPSHVASWAAGLQGLAPGRPRLTPRSYIYRRKRLLKAALAAARAAEGPLQPRGAPIHGPTAAASSLTPPPSCIPQPPPLLGAVWPSGQGCPQVFFADSLPRTPSTSLFSSHILHGKHRAVELKMPPGANGRRHF